MSGLLRSQIPPRMIHTLASARTQTTPCATSIRFFRTTRAACSKGGSTKRPRIHTSEASVDATWYTSKGARSSSLEMGRYGLTRLNYATLEPPVWTIPPHPPTKSATEKVLFPLTIVATGAVVLWAYMNPEEDDMTEYWKRVETGKILVDDDDDDDDDDWDDDDEE